MRKRQPKPPTWVVVLQTENDSSGVRMVVADRKSRSYSGATTYTKQIEIGKVMHRDRQTGEPNLNFSTELAELRGLARDRASDLNILVDSE